MIVFNDIVSSERHLRILTPSDAHTDVGGVVDQVMRHNGILSRKQEDPNGAVVVGAAMMNIVIGDSVALVLVFLRRGCRVQVETCYVSVSCKNAAAPEIRNLVPFNDVECSAVSQAYTHAADMGNSSIGKAAR